MREKYYDSGLHTVAPETPLEVDVIRQVILPDKWDVVSESPVVPHLDVLKLLLKNGGQLVFHGRWSSKLIMHYVVGELLLGEVYDLTVTVYDNTSGSRIGSLQLGVCLVKVQGPHHFIYWPRGRANSEMKRSGFFLPQWGLLANREPALGMKIKVQEETIEQPQRYTGLIANTSWQQFAISVGVSHSYPALDNIEAPPPVSPHVILIDPDEISGDRC
jgi:hypothetical protein